MAVSNDALYRMLVKRGVSRRAFLKFSAAMAAALALPASYAPRIARAVAAAPRLPVIWLEGQDCAGNTEGFLRASHPSVAELVLDTLSVDYHETIMTASGEAAEAAREQTMRDFKDGYIVVIEGSIPLAENGIYCTIGGRTFKNIVEDVCKDALAVIAVGSCAFDGGLPAAAGGPTGATGVAQIVPSATLVNLPGCPMNVQNLTATIVHYLTFGTFPATDTLGRPLFAYGQLIHDQCERRAHFEAGRFVMAWGDEGARKGYCLYKMGCKGPETYANCPTTRFNDGASWPVKTGHGCVGCTMPRFWDQMSPFYRRLPTAPAFASDVNADAIGLTLVGAVAGLSAAHGIASYARKRRQGPGGGEATGPGPALDPYPPAGSSPPVTSASADETGESSKGIQA